MESGKQRKVNRQKRVKSLQGEGEARSIFPRAAGDEGAAYPLKFQNRTPPPDLFGDPVRLVYFDSKITSVDRCFRVLDSRHLDLLVSERSTNMVVMVVEASFTSSIPYDQRKERGFSPKHFELSVLCTQLSMTSSASTTNCELRRRKFAR